MIRSARAKKFPVDDPVQELLNRVHTREFLRVSVWEVPPNRLRRNVDEWRSYFVIITVEWDSAVVQFTSPEDLWVTQIRVKSASEFIGTLFTPSEWIRRRYVEVVVLLIIVIIIQRRCVVVVDTAISNDTGRSCIESEIRFNLPVDCFSIQILSLSKRRFWWRKNEWKTRLWCCTFNLCDLWRRFI